MSFGVQLRGVLIGQQRAETFDQAQRSPQIGATV